MNQKPHVPYTQGKSHTVKIGDHVFVWNDSFQADAHHGIVCAVRSWSDFDIHETWLDGSQHVLHIEDCKKVIPLDSPNTYRVKNK